MGLWSMGMTESKTQTVNKKLMQVAHDAMAFGEDPVYGPFIEQHQGILMQDLEKAFTKYDKTMQMKYFSDPKFKALADDMNHSLNNLGQELGNE